MNIRYYKGDDHKISFKFSNLTGEIQDIIFEAKYIDESITIKKKLGDGIDFANDWYHIILKPEDTLKIPRYKKMIYDIKIIINNLTYTVKRGYMKLL